MAQSSASFDLLQSSFNNNNKSYKALFFDQSFNSLMGVHLLKVSSEWKFWFCEVLKIEHDPLNSWLLCDTEKSTAACDRL